MGDYGVAWLNIIPPESFLGPDGLLRYFISTEGERVASYYWPAHGKPKAVIQLVHGHGSYLCYEYLEIPAPGEHGIYSGSWIQAWNKAGYSVCGIDLHGLGRSSGLRAFTASFDQYVNETLQFTSIVRASDVPGFAGLPIFAVGGSLGGCIATTAAIKDQGAFAGLVLLAPMLSLERVSKQGLNRLLRPVADLLAWLVPSAPIVATAKNVMYPYLQECWDKDPATYSEYTRVSNAASYLRATEWLMANLQHLALPLITFHSEHDTMTDPDGSHQLLERATSADKQLRHVNDMWHIITKEKGNEAVRDEIAAWIAQRCGAAS